MRRTSARFHDRFVRAVIVFPATLPSFRAKNPFLPLATILRATESNHFAEAAPSLFDLYRTLETPSANRLCDARAALDAAVRIAYRMKDTEATLAFLLRLNLALAEKGARGETIVPPGLPVMVVGGERLHQRRLHHLTPIITTAGNQVERDADRNCMKEIHFNESTIPYLAPHE
jgi:hypothetical protein